MTCFYYITSIALLKWKYYTMLLDVIRQEKKGANWATRLLCFSSSQTLLWEAVLHENSMQITDMVELDRHTVQVSKTWEGGQYRQTSIYSLSDDSLVQEGELVQAINDADAAIPNLDIQFVQVGTRYIRSEIHESGFASEPRRLLDPCTYHQRQSAKPCAGKYCTGKGCAASIKSHMKQAFLLRGKPVSFHHGSFGKPARYVCGSRVYWPLIWRRLHRHTA